MEKHIFLTGPKRVGKSSIIKKVLAAKQGRAGGFLTVKTDAVWPGCPSLHLLDISRGEEPGEANLISRSLLEPDARSAERFDTLGCAAIAAGREAHILVMDELGPREAEAKNFRASVLQALEGDVPVLGVLQQAESPFLTQIAKHPRVQLIPVTVENRELVLNRLLQKAP